MSLKKITKNKYIKGFTLAEILITITIIGIISGLTIPSLIHSVQDQQLKIAYKKAFSVASQSYIAAINDRGSGFGTYHCTGGTGDPIEKWNGLKSNLSVVKECDAGTSLGNCWAGTSPDTSMSAGCGGFMIANQNLSKSFVTNDGATYVLYPWCEVVAVDVNGLKPPNMWGVDVFIFVLDDNKITPGMCETTGNSRKYLLE